MQRKMRGLAVVGLCVVTVAVGGCDILGLLNILGPARLSDGGGGNVLSAGTKVVTGQMTELTQDELQILNDQVTSFLQGSNPSIPTAEMTNEQADGVIDFLAQNSVPGGTTTGLNSIEEIQAFAEAAQADPSIITIPQTLIDAYADSTANIDTENIDINELFSGILGALGGTTTTTTTTE